MPVRFCADGRWFEAQAFLFDKDGTIITFEHWFSVMVERAKRLSRVLGLSSSQAEALVRFMRGKGPGDWGIIPLPRPEAEEATARYLAQMLEIPPSEALAVVKKVFAEVDHDFPFEKNLKPTPGAEEILRMIKAAGGKIGVVTHDVAAAARLHLRALGWEELVDVLVGLDLCPVKKPAPEPVWRACEHLSMSPREAVMVGDTVTDLQAGRAAGCRATFGVLTGLGTPEELHPHADAILESLRKLRIEK